MRPEEAPDASAALRTLYGAVEENDAFRIALIDMQMPDMDGEVLGRTVNLDQRLIQTRLVMMTSLGTRGEARRFEAAGFCAYLTKPLRYEELRDVLLLVLSKERGLKATGPLITRHTAREALPRFSEGVRILLVEDNVTNQQVALGILKKLGLTADAVAHGGAAVDAVRQLPYDLVLMDVQMPEVDGLEATRRIRDPREGALNPGIPIIAMTAHAMQGDRETCLAAGMDDYVAKPVSPQALARIMQKWLVRGPDSSFPPPQGKTSGQTPSPMEDIPSEKNKIFNRSALLGRLLGDEALMKRVLSEFLMDMPSVIAGAREAVKQANTKDAGTLVHKIAGAAANIDAGAFHRVASDMERAARTGDPETLKKLMPTLENRFQQLKETLALEK
jgi:CheY-like chemotaxis protein/HPt (histidine-containing phosphotransfer) domain-containing protein